MVLRPKHTGSMIFIFSWDAVFNETRNGIEKEPVSNESDRRCVQFECKVKIRNLNKRMIPAQVCNDHQENEEIQTTMESELLLQIPLVIQHA